MLRQPAKFPISYVISLAALCAICAFGGASRSDVLSHIVVQWIAAGLIAYAWFHRANSANVPRLPALFLFSLAGLMLLQLLPLPPALWQTLPGRELFADIDSAAGLQGTWRPISLVPDATLSSLLGLVAPAAALAILSLVPRNRWHIVLLAVLTLIVTSAVLGLLQVSAPNSALYFYRVTNHGSPVGFFANRNHQAILLALSSPFLVALLLGWQGRLASSGLFRPALFAVFLLCLVATLVNGSRIGFATFIIGLAGAAAMYRSFPATQKGDKQISRRQAVKMRRAKLAGAALITAVLGTIVVLSSRSLQTVDRLTETSLSDEGRLKLFLPLLDIAKAYFPFGSGFGSFPEIYKIHEADEQLTLSYLNHAHNDYVEFAIEGGAFAVFLMAAAILGIAFKSVAAWRGWGLPLTRRALYARLGSIMAVIAMAGSATDYPLRTPALGLIFMLGMLWLWSLDDDQFAVDPSPIKSKRVEP